MPGLREGFLEGVALGPAGTGLSEGPGFEAGASVHLSLQANCPRWQPTGSMQPSEKPPEPHRQLLLPLTDSLQSPDLACSGSFPLPPAPPLLGVLWILPQTKIPNHPHFSVSSVQPS